MSRFGIVMVVVALSAGLAAQTSDVPTSPDPKSIKTVRVVPWLDPSLANSPDRATILAIGVASARECSASSSAICYGFCARSSDQQIKQQNTPKSKATDADEAGNRKLSTEN